MQLKSEQITIEITDTLLQQKTSRKYHLIQNKGVNDISVHYEDGTLSMSLPKKEQDPGRTRIPVTMK